MLNIGSWPFSDPAATKPRDYIQARKGDWTLSATLGTQTVGPYPNPQFVEGDWVFTVHNEYDANRPYKKYRESYADGVIVAEFFDRIDAITPCATATYQIQSASFPVKERANLAILIAQRSPQSAAFLR